MLSKGAAAQFCLSVCSPCCGLQILCLSICLFIILSLSLYIYIYLPIFLFFLINLSYLFSLSNQSNPFAYLSSIVSIYDADDYFPKWTASAIKQTCFRHSQHSLHMSHGGACNFALQSKLCGSSLFFFIPPSRSSYLSNRSNLVYLSNLCNYLTTVSNYLLSRTKSNRSIHLFIYRFYSCLCVCDVNGLYQAITVVDTRQLRPAVDATA